MLPPVFLLKLGSTREEPCREAVWRTVPCEELRGVVWRTLELALALFDRLLDFDDVSTLRVVDLLAADDDETLREGVYDLREELFTPERGAAPAREPELVFLRETEEFDFWL